jgi:hypothetical protein
VDRIFPIKKLGFRAGLKNKNPPERGGFWLFEKLLIY